MADVTISQLTQGALSGYGLIPYSQGGNTLSTSASALFENIQFVGINTIPKIGIDNGNYSFNDPNISLVVKSPYTSPSSIPNTTFYTDLTGNKRNFIHLFTNREGGWTPGGNNIALVYGSLSALPGSIPNYARLDSSFTIGAWGLTSGLHLSSNGNVGVGITNAKSRISVQGSERIIAADAESEYEQDRYFTFKKHYSVKGVTNSAYTRLIQFRPYLSGTTNYPSGTNFWTRVGVKIRTGGHTSSVGNGERSFIGSFDYVGNGIGSVVTLQDLQNGTFPLLNLTFSGWEAYIDIKGANGAAGSFGGYCYIELNFGSGEGNFGESIVWNLSEYY